MASQERTPRQKTLRRAPHNYGQPQRRLACGEDHLNRAVCDWMLVLSIDKSTYCLYFLNGLDRVWQQPRVRYQDAWVRYQHRYGDGSMTVWEAAAWHARLICTSLHKAPQLPTGTEIKSSMSMSGLLLVLFMIISS
ncbi:hypothetical protein ACOMHN_018956 [Nucella lapillus]